MLKLFKYEFIKTRLSKLIILGITLALELVFLYGLISDNDATQSLGVVLLVELAVCSVLWIGIQSVLTLHKDMNTRQSYMLFMTPNSCYTILGAKVLENGLSVLLGGAFFGALGFLDVTLLMSHHQALEELLETMRKLIEAFAEQVTLDPMSLISFGCYTLFSWLSTVTLAYLAVIIATALLNGKKGSLFIAFLIFLALSLLTGRLYGQISPFNASNVTVYFVRSAASVAIVAITYYFSARIMEKYLSV